MGYACPVCDAPQADDGHLANHLAFTALLRGGEHETWLDEQVPDWESLDEAGLAERVVDHASTVEYPRVFDDTTGGPEPAPDGHDGHGRGAVDEHAHGSPLQPNAGADSVARLLDGVDFSALRADEAIDDEELDEIIAHARELTRHRREESETD